MYWIELWHPEPNSPIHSIPEEGPELFFAEDKFERRIRNRLNIGHKILIYETEGHPENRDWRGAKAIGALAIVRDNPLFREDFHRNALTKNPENWKIPIRYEFCLRDWRNGVHLDRIREILNYRGGGGMRSTFQIRREQFNALEVELRTSGGDRLIG